LLATFLTMFIKLLGNPALVALLIQVLQKGLKLAGG
jgi:hypothetical protein